MMTKRYQRLGYLAAAALLIGSSGQTMAVEVFSDTFSDGLWNGALWKKASWDDGGLKEMKGHLALRTLGATVPDYVATGWSANFDRTYDGNDYLDLQARVRMPHVITNANKDCSIGIGFYQSRTDHNYIELTVEDNYSNRFFYIYYDSSTTATDKEWKYPVPPGISVFRLRMLYTAATDKVNFFWSTPGSTTWTKIRPALTLHKLFNRFPPHLIRPYVVGYADNTRIPLSWNIYLDDFVAAYGNVP